MNMNTKEKVKAIERKLIKFFKDENRENQTEQNKKESKQSTTDKG